MFKLIALVVLGCSYVYAENQAIVILTSKTGVSGTIHFKQTDEAVAIEGEIHGLTPGKHGFHVHNKGDLSDGCTSTGSHFNPFNKSHGAPNVTDRHVGDLGNIEADENGVAKFSFNDSIICLKAGDSNIIGRAIVVHEGEDDLGVGGHEDSLTTGHAGGRVACGIIAIASDEWDWKSVGTSTSFNIFLLLTVTISSIFVSGLD